MARYLRVTWSPADGCFASDRLTPDQRGHVGNSDVPGPYRQDSAGDYGSAEFGIGRNAGYGRSGPGGRRPPWRRPARRRRRSGRGQRDGRSDDDRPAGRAPAAARSRPAGLRGGSRGYPAANASGPGQVADDLRNRRLGVRGRRGRPARPPGLPGPRADRAPTQAPGRPGPCRTATPGRPTPAPATGGRPATATPARPTAAAVPVAGAGTAAPARRRARWPWRRPGRPERARPPPGSGAAAAELRGVVQVG